MYKIEKNNFLPKNKMEKDRSYFIDVLNRFGALEDDTCFYLPDEVISPIKEASIDKIIYEYFELVWTNEKRNIEIKNIVGSHDYRNYNLKTWLMNFFTYVDKTHLEKYFQNLNKLFKEENALKAFEKDGQYYLADGHHRFSTLYVHYHILKSQNKLPNSFPSNLPSIIRVIPNDIEFIRKFVEFCIKNHLYEEDEIGIIPMFEIIDSNPNNPLIRHIETQIIITKESNLEEVLTKIKKEKAKNYKYKK